MQDAAANQKKCNILVSQPRKIAAVMNSMRVAHEVKCSIGTFVGFQHSLMRHADKHGEKTKMLFCTTGVILQKLLLAKSMEMYTHIILGSFIKDCTMISF